MRIGVVGPSEEDEEALREAVSFLLGDADAEHVVYLGSPEFLERAIASWVTELGGAEAEAEFVSRAVEIAIAGSPEALEHLLARDAELEQLERVRKLPAPPARAVEMMDDRMVLFVHDKAILDEDDIANAQLIVYGRGAESDLRQFGRRAFFTPGPLAGGRVGVLEASDDGVTVALYDLAGMPVWRECIAQRGSKLKVAR